MGTGLGIFLLVVGAILKFAVKDSVQGVDLEMIGLILMGAGVLSLVLTLIMQQQRRHTRHDAVIERHDTTLPPSDRY
ncbi:DUF6458 family protein [Arsenicicoccus sp. oral taxon 190]|uniref:DUF6458 family protein n=1 Tax=Arsenicicoccus sp. oral taxon 190 TaxID=1658671 RepID=UPI000679F574|nr:DUF6458 family protein [Arsenicicoccus sp. oral taxon 190]AKT52558.1 hypothetical protein ADJ73_03230 [Arsenicicoccus sp. oral taxon 190]